MVQSEYGFIQMKKLSFQTDLKVYHVSGKRTPSKSLGNYNLQSRKVVALALD
jgi:hypothetical protein